MASVVTVWHNPVVIRKARSQDCGQIFKFVVELAEFLNSRDSVKTTVDDLHRDLFGDSPVCRCLVATTEADPSTLIGYCVFYRAYSPWTGSILYLEDIYVSADHRGRGVGKLLWQRVTQAGLDMGCKGLRLSVLSWNKGAINMYARHGCVDLAETRNEHTMYMDKIAMVAFVRDWKSRVLQTRNPIVGL